MENENNITVEQTTNLPKLFTAGNRQIDKITLENALSKHFDTYMNTYAETWGRKNTEEVYKSYLDIMDAIHNDKVSMNIDGSLHINDGSLINIPDRSGFDPNGAVAYYVKKVAETIPDYKAPEEKKKEGKKYTLDTFIINFVKSLTPQDYSTILLNLDWWKENWLGLDSEVTDDQGNRSRPYLNRLKVFKEFLSKEIENLNNYSEAGEEYGDLDTVKLRMIDLLQRLEDNDISLEDRLALTRLGFNPSLFTTLGTPKTEEELKSDAEAKAKAEEEEKLNKGRLDGHGISFLTAKTNFLDYKDYIAATYGVGKEGYEKVTSELQGLLNLMYENKKTPMSIEDRRQIGGLIYLLRQTSPLFKNSQISEEELAELKSHKGFRPEDVNLYRLPWQTSDGRYIYASDLGAVYFLKPSNLKIYNPISGEDINYINNFLKDTKVGKEAFRDLEYLKDLQRQVFKDPTWLDLTELGSVLPDIASIIDPEPFSAAGLALTGAGMRHVADANRPGSSIVKNIGNHLLDYGIAAVSALPFAGDAALGWRVYNTIKKFLPWVLTVPAVMQAPDVMASVKKAMHSGVSSLTMLDWRHIQMAITLGIGAGRAKLSKNRETAIKEAKGEGTSSKEVVGKIKVSDGKKEVEIEVPKKVYEQVKKDFTGKGNDNKAKAEVLKKNEEVKKYLKDKGIDMDSENFTVVADKSLLASSKLGKYGKTTGITKDTKTTESGDNHLSDYLAELRSRGTYGKWLAKGVENAEKFRRWTGGDGEIKWWESVKNAWNPYRSRKKPTASETKPEVKTETVEESFLNAFNTKHPTQAQNRIIKALIPHMTSELLAKVQDYRSKWETLTKEEKDDFLKIVTEARLKEKAVESKKALEEAKKKAEFNKIENKYKVLPKKRTGKDSKTKKDIYEDFGDLIELTIKGNTPPTELTINSKVFKYTSVLMAGKNRRAYYKSDDGDIIYVLYPSISKKLEGGKLIKLYQLKRGGIIKGQQGILINPGTTWYDDIFTPYQEYILEQLKLNKEYAKWLNEMLSTHARLYKSAGTNFLLTAWLSPDVAQYQINYSNDSKATGNKLEGGYNYGIRNAHKKGRYRREGVRTGRDWETTNYEPDALYSGETDDRRILGRKGDWSPELLAAFNTLLKGLGFHLYLDTTDNYYKLGTFDENNNPVDRYFSSSDETSNRSNERIGDPITHNTITPPDADGNIPGGELPEVVVKPDNTNHSGSDVKPYMTNLDINTFDPKNALLKLALGSLGLSSVLGHIATTNRNYREAAAALRKIRLLDPVLKYHQEVDDYAGNLVAEEYAAEINNRGKKAVSSDKNFNEARALEAENKAISVLAKQKVADLEMRLKHAAVSEQYGNENRAARIDVGNKNGLLLYDLANRLAGIALQRNYANWTSINNWIQEQIFRGRQELDKQEAIRDNWIANRLGSKSAWIKNKLNSDAAYIKAVTDYRNLKDDATEAEKTAAINALIQAQNKVIRQAGEEWDRLYAQTYNLPYYTYSNPFEDELADILRYYRLSATADETASKLPTPKFKRGGAVDAYVQAMKSLTERANSLDISERERLRARKADAERFMKSVWKAIDLYIQQSKNLYKK